MTRDTPTHCTEDKLHNINLDNCQASSLILVYKSLEIHGGTVNTPLVLTLLKAEINLLSTRDSPCDFIRLISYFVLDWQSLPTIIPFQSGTMAPELDHNQSNAFITAIFLFFSQPRLTAGCEKKVCARCANWKTEQQLIVMSSGKNSRMNKMQDIPTWPSQVKHRHFLFTSE